MAPLRNRTNRFETEPCQVVHRVNEDNIPISPSCRYNNFVREKQGKVADGISRRLVEKQRQVLDKWNRQDHGGLTACLQSAMTEQTEVVEVERDLMLSAKEMISVAVRRWTVDN